METVYVSETLVSTYESARYHNPEEEQYLRHRLFLPHIFQFLSHPTIWRCITNILGESFLKKQNKKTANYVR
jgi:hypothetical protein